MSPILIDKRTNAHDCTSTIDEQVNVYEECEFCSGLFPIPFIERHIKLGHSFEWRNSAGILSNIRRIFAVTELKCDSYFDARELDPCRFSDRLSEHVTGDSKENVFDAQLDLNIDAGVSASSTFAVPNVQTRKQSFARKRSKRRDDTDTVFERSVSSVSAADSESDNDPDFAPSASDAKPVAKGRRRSMRTQKQSMNPNNHDLLGGLSSPKKHRRSKTRATIAKVNYTNPGRHMVSKEGGKFLSDQQLLARTDAENMQDMETMPSVSEFVCDSEGVNWLPITFINRQLIAFLLCHLHDNPNPHLLSTHYPTHVPTDTSKLYIYDLRRHDEQRCTNAELVRTITESDLNHNHVSFKKQWIAYDRRNKLGVGFNGERVLYVKGINGLDKDIGSQHNFTHVIHLSAWRSASCPDLIRYQACIVSFDQYMQSRNDRNASQKGPENYPFSLMLMAYRYYSLHDAAQMRDHSGKLRKTEDNQQGAPSMSTNLLHEVNGPAESSLNNSKSVAKHKLRRRSTARAPLTRDTMLSKREFGRRPRELLILSPERDDAERMEMAKKYGYDNSINGPFLSSDDFVQRMLEVASAKPGRIIGPDEIEVTEEGVTWLPLDSINTNIAIQYLMASYHCPYLVSQEIPMEVPTDRSKGFIFDLCKARQLTPDVNWEYEINTDDSGQLMRMGGYGTELCPYKQTADGSWVRANVFGTGKFHEQLIDDVTMEYTHLLMMMTWFVPACPDLLKYRLQLTTRESYWRQIVRAAAERPVGSRRTDNDVKYDIAMVFYEWVGKPRTFTRLNHGALRFLCRTSKYNPKQAKRQRGGPHSVMTATYRISQLARKYIYDQLVSGRTTSDVVSEMLSDNKLRQKFRLQNCPPERLKNAIVNMAHHNVPEHKRAYFQYGKKKKQRTAVRDAVNYKPFDSTLEEVKSTNLEADGAGTVLYDARLEDEELFTPDEQKARAPTESAQSLLTEPMERLLARENDMDDNSENGPFVSDAQIETQLKDEAKRACFGDAISNTTMPTCVPCASGSSDTVWLSLPHIHQDLAFVYLLRALRQPNIVSTNIPQTVPCDQSMGYIYDMRHVNNDIKKYRALERQLSLDNGGTWLTMKKFRFDKFMYTVSIVEGRETLAHSGTHTGIKGTSLQGNYKTVIESGRHPEPTHVIRLNIERNMSCPDLFRYRYYLAYWQDIGIFANEVAKTMYKRAHPPPPFLMVLVCYRWYGKPRDFRPVQFSKRAHSLLENEYQIFFHKDKS